MRMHQNKTVRHREIEIDEVRTHYDGCSTSSLKKAKEFYADWEYIGSGRCYYIDGVKNQSKDLMHCFVKPNK